MFDKEYLNIVKKKAIEEHIPILMDETLNKIKEILIKEKPKRILEIGTAVGYSASCFVEIMLDVIVDTIEIDEERARIAIENINKIGITENINVIIGNAVEILPNLETQYDIVFIDANKGKYPFFLEQGIRLARNDGLIIADNILYKGYVLGDYNKHKQRTAVKNLRNYIKISEEDERLDTQILEIGDGLAVSRVRKFI